jgi:hypothetical protein
MMAMCLTDVYQGQHHKNKCLQQNNEDVKDGPSRPCNDMPYKTKHAEVETKGPNTAEQCDEQENELARIHVAEQSHAQGNPFGDVLYDV